MDKTILFSELNYSQTNFNMMKNILEREGIPNITSFGSYNHFQNMNNNLLINNLISRFDIISRGSSVNIICQGAGCNIGLILAKERALQINSAVFLSPELERATMADKLLAFLFKTEKINSILFGAKYFDHSTEEKIELDKQEQQKLHKLHRQTQSLAKQCLPNITYLPNIVITAHGDKQTSKKGAYKLAKQLQGRLLVAETSHHNILLTDSSQHVSEATAKEIAKFEEQNRYHLTRF